LGKPRETPGNGADRDGSERAASEVDSRYSCRYSIGGRAALYAAIAKKINAKQRLTI